MPVLRFFCNELTAVSVYNLFRKIYQACKDFRNHRFIREIRFHRETGGFDAESRRNVSFPSDLYIYFL